MIHDVKEQVFHAMQTFSYMDTQKDLFPRPKAVTRTGVGSRPELEVEVRVATDVKDESDSMAFSTKIGQLHWKTEHLLKVCVPLFYLWGAVLSSASSPCADASVASPPPKLLPWHHMEESLHCARTARYF